MRTPWFQVSQELVEIVAPEVSCLVCVDELRMLGGLVRLVKWALGRCPEEEPPSWNDVVRGPNAARLIASAAGYGEDPRAFVAACVESSHPILEMVDDGIRIRGLDRYDTAWGKNHPAVWKALQEGRCPESWVGTSREKRFRSKLEPKSERVRNEPEPKPVRDCVESPSPDADADAYEKKETSAHAREASPRPGPVPPSAEIEGATLREKLEAVYERIRGKRYAWGDGDLHVRDLQRLTDDDDEIVRQFERALRRRFPTCNSLRELKRDDVWNAPDEEPPAKGPAPPAAQRTGISKQVSHPCAVCGVVSEGGNVWGFWLCHPHVAAVMKLPAVNQQAIDEWIQQRKGAAA